MASKSLNQAFIKAYSKGRNAETNRSSASDAGLEEEAYILRVDTATVAVPAPHMLHPKPDRRPTVVARVGDGPMPKNLTSTVDEDSLSDSAAAREEALRCSIASQMIQAGVWQDQRIDAFMGGFPMVVNDSLGNTEQEPQPIKEGGSASPTVSKERDEADANSNAVASDESSGGDHSTVVRSAPVEADSPQHVRAQASVGEGSVKEGSSSVFPELESPLAPALSFEVVERAVNELAKERRKQGEIFRLDRPSYSSESVANNPQPVRADDDSIAQHEAYEDSGEQSSIISFSESAVERNDVEELPPSPNTASTREVEEGLRRARLKIFNPVWEVDSFQWPEVCVELLKQRQDNMQLVAKNMITACQEGLQVLAVTSPQGGEGRTTVACCLAMLAGSHGLNVAIVDGDIENPTLSLQTNLDVQQDWKTAIFSQMSLEDVAVHSIDDQVTLLPLLSPIQQTEMASDDNRIAFMLHELSESFDLVIVDMGHMDSTRSLVTSMGEQGIISAVVTVVDHRSTSPQRIEACLRRIRRTGISSIGLVENFAA